MGKRRGRATPDNSDEESGEAFTDGDFGDSDEGADSLEPRGVITDDLGTLDTSQDEGDAPGARTIDPSALPVTETLNMDVKIDVASNDTCNENGFGQLNGSDDHPKVNGLRNGHSNGTDGHAVEHASNEIRRDSHGDQNPSIVGILGGQQNHAEQRLAARRAARAEAREIRMRELERQQREQEDHADKAYDMYSAETVSRRTTPRLTGLSPALTPRRSSEDSADDGFSVKDLRHELKEVEEKFRKAMILNAQLDNDKAALGYQRGLLQDRLEELQEDHAQLQREHREKCSAHERLKREHASVEREVVCARDAIRARDAAVAAAGYVFVEAGSGTDLPGFGSVPPLALVSRDADSMLNDAGEGTLDVRLQKLLSAKQSLESEVRKLKLTLNEERAARLNGGPHHPDIDDEVESLRKSCAEARGRAARAEAEAALQGAAVARLEATAARLRAREEARDADEELLKQDRRRLQREAREALNRVEELETENSHLTKRLDKLKNAKSALLKDL